MTLTIAQKCQAAGIALPTYYFRIKNGMTPEEALSTSNKRRLPKSKSAQLPQPEPEIEDQEPRAPLMIKTCGVQSCVFEKDQQERQRQARKRAKEMRAKSASASSPARPEEPKTSSYVEELGGRNQKTPNKRLKAPPPVASPDYEEVNNYEYVNRKPLRYGPIVKAKHSNEPEPWDKSDEARFNRACGGYTAAILNHTKDGEFKYQIYSTNTQKKLYTNDIVRFINQIIKICDPEGKTPFRVIER